MGAASSGAIPALSQRAFSAISLPLTFSDWNEGHAALLGAALLRRHPHPTGRPAEGASRYDADRVREQCVFTTHTPVEAGYDRFAYDDAARLLSDFIETDQLKLLAGQDRLNMTRLALNLSNYVNGVAIATPRRPGRCSPVTASGPSPMACTSRLGRTQPLAASFRALRRTGPRSGGVGRGGPAAR